MRNGTIARQKGSVLIVLIIAMIIAGTLGTSMYLLTSTSSFGSLVSNRANRALLLAESGIRYDQKISLADGTVTVNINSGADQFVIVKSTDAGTGVKTTVSTGIADANSSWPVRRKMTYVSGASGGGGGSGPGPPTAVPMTTVSGGSGNSTGSFTIATHHGNAGAAKVAGTTGNVDNPQTYPEAYGSPAWTTNPFCQPWSTAGNYLSYDVQLKVAEEHNTVPDWWVNRQYNLDDVVRANLPDGNTYDLICKQSHCQALPYISCGRRGCSWVLNGWNSVVFVYNLGLIFRVNALNEQTTAYGLTFYRSTFYTDGATPIDGSPTTMMPDNLPDNEPAIVLFTRDGSSGSDNHWLAYMQIDDTDHVVDQYGFLKDWNTLLARVVEGASIKLSATSAPNIAIGDQVTGGAGAATIIGKINDSDGRVVLLLNSVSGTFSSPVTVGGQSYTTYNDWGDAGSVPAWQSGVLYHVGDWAQRNSVNYRCIREHTSKNNNPGRIRPPNATYWVVDTPTSFYRPRDNFIWAFYADTDNHTNYNATATDNTRREKDLFPDDLTGYSPAFPLTDVQAWDAANDEFTLVTWATGASNLNTAVDSSLRLMGTGKELNAIIRTNRWVTGSYTTDCASFPPEIGIISKGTTSLQNAYDDLAYRILQSAGTGGTPSSGYYSY